MTKKVSELIKLSLKELEDKILLIQEECIMVLKPYVSKNPLVIPEKILIIYREFVADYLNFSFAYLHKKISAIESDLFALKISALNSTGENHYIALYNKQEFIKILNTNENSRNIDCSYLQGSNIRINQVIFAAGSALIPFTKERDGMAVDAHITKRRNNRPTHGDNSINTTYRVRFQEMEHPRKNYSTNIMLINRALEDHPQLGSVNYSVGTIICPVRGMEILTLQEFDAYCKRIIDVA